MTRIIRKTIREPIPVKSTNVAAVSWRGDDLIVWFHGGAVYRYTGAAEHLDALRDASSPGKYFAANIKGKFAYQRKA